MANVLIEEAILQDWANHIRSVNETEDKMIPSVLLEKTKELGIGGGSSDLVKYVTFMSYDGTTELYIKPTITGDDCVDIVAEGLLETPTRDSDAQYNYTYSGWSREPNGSEDATALSDITEDRVLYATFDSSVRYYTVNFYDDTELLRSVQVEYGGTVEYIPEKDDFAFVSWTPEPNNVTGDMNCYASWTQEGFGADSWELINERSLNGTLQDYYELGDTKSFEITLSDGTTKTVTMAIAGFGIDDLADGGGKAGLTLVQIGSMGTEIKASVSCDAEDFESEFYSLIPDELINVIKPVTKLWSGAEAESVIWMPDDLEIFTSSSSTYTDGTLFPLLEDKTDQEKYEILRWDAVLSRSFHSYKITSSIQATAHSWFYSATNAYGNTILCNNRKTSASQSVPDFEYAICFCI